MADEQINGPVMINATRVLKSDGIRIGKISNDITLPRTVRLVTAVSVGAGAAVTLLIALLFGTSAQNLIYAAVIGGFIGFAASSYSPLRGESLGTWLTLQITSARSSRRIDGKSVTLNVGVAPAQRLAEGKVQLRRSAVRVAAGSVDDRGVFAQYGRSS